MERIDNKCNSEAFILHVVSNVYFFNTENKLKLHVHKY